MLPEFVIFPIPHFNYFLDKIFQTTLFTVTTFLLPRRLTNNSHHFISFTPSISIMENNSTANRAPIPSPKSSDLSPLSSILALLALIAIPTLIYAFFFAIKCPPNPFRLFRRSSRTLAGELSSRSSGDRHLKSTGLVAGVRYKKEAADEKEYGSECPVCLSMFSDGEEIWQLKVCNHLFHAGCIDMWLYSHSNCPVCRASVFTVKRSKPPVLEGENDLRQGLPDSTSLV